MRIRPRVTRGSDGERVLGGKTARAVLVYDRGSRCMHDRLLIRDVEACFRSDGTWVPVEIELPTCRPCSQGLQIRDREAGRFDEDRRGSPTPRDDEPVL